MDWLRGRLQSRSLEGPSKGGDGFNDFLLSEYSNIAHAHFKTSETISAFIKHYLAIISAPIAILGMVVSMTSWEGLDPDLILSTVFIVGILFIVISLAGFLVLPYVINLRMDALLYARTVNGIRKYFFDRECQLGNLAKGKLRVLPQSPLLPRYQELVYFGPIVVLFGLLNSVYFFSGCTAAIFGGSRSSSTISLAAVSTVIFFAIHLLSYLRIASRREDAYLRSNIIGVDIDGVLNLHKRQFCDKLRTATENAEEPINIQPKQITAIPVHDCPGLGITRDHEKTVFNGPDYWTEMEPMPNSAEVLKELRNSMRLKVHIFTHRPWPDTDHLKPKDRKAVRDAWADTASTYCRTVRHLQPWWYSPVAWVKAIGRVLPYRSHSLRTLIQPRGYIGRITGGWLEKNGFEYDRLMIERGSEQVADSSSHIINRFYACRVKSIRYFVEDDLIKAKKLAFICDVVFLVDQPYNQREDYIQGEDLPANIIRVKSWEEILHHMREIC